MIVSSKANSNSDSSFSLPVHMDRVKTNPIQKNSIEVENLILQMQQEEGKENVSLRPSALTQYIGQSKIKKQLQLILDSAKIRESMPENLLFYGQPGLGKTTLASLISSELGCGFKVVSAPSLQRVGDLVTLLLNLEQKTILFIDEIHRLKAPLEETLYIAMEDKQVDLVMGKGHGAKATRIDLPQITFVGATTLLGKISKPLKDRFTSVFHLEAYSQEEILKLINRNSKILGLKLDEPARTVVAKHSRGIPRITNHLLKRLLDYQLVNNLSFIKADQVTEFFDELGIFELGLTKADLHYLKALRENLYLGVKTLSSLLMEEVETLEIVTEPYLIFLGLVNKTSKGREITKKGKDLLKKLKY